MFIVRFAIIRIGLQPVDFNPNYANQQSAEYIAAASAIQNLVSKYSNNIILILSSSFQCVSRPVECVFSNYENDVIIRDTMRLILNEGLNLHFRMQSKYSRYIHTYFSDIYSQYNRNIH